MPRDTDLVIGNRLREERRLAGQSLEDFAHLLRIDPALLTRYEQGEARVGAALLARAAHLLRLSLALFLWPGPADYAGENDGAGDELRWLAIPRPLSQLKSPRFAALHAVLAEWRASRGELTAGTRIGQPLLGRTHLMRSLPSSSRLIVEHSGAGIAHLLPCESLWRVGRDIEEVPDRDYGLRSARAYAQVAYRPERRVDSVRALIRMSSGSLLRTRYDRLFLPWRYKGNDLFVMCISLRRETPSAVS